MHLWPEQELLDGKVATATGAEPVAWSEGGFECLIKSSH